MPESVGMLTWRCANGTSYLSYFWSAPITRLIRGIYTWSKLLMNHLEPISRCSNYKHTVFVHCKVIWHLSLQQLMRSSHPYTKVLAILCEIHRCHLFPCQGRQRGRDNGGLSQYHCTKCFMCSYQSGVLFWGHMLQDQIISPPWGFCCLPRLG